ncbi:hypothetical protein KKC45_03065 [Patescibacteria group bacterium]|nr:hypothetical protein [Patescibacteria group bacterium]
MGSNIKIRIILDIFIVISIAIFPWWFTTLLAIVGLFKVDFFFEAFVFAVIMDSLYYVPREIFFERPYVSLLVVTILFFFIKGFKKRLRV